MSYEDPSAVLAKLRHENRELKAACRQLANTPEAGQHAEGRVLKLGRELQQARRAYDQALESKRKQEAQLEQIISQFKELTATAGVEQQDPHSEGQAKQLKSQIDSVVAQVNEAYATHLAYQDFLKRMKQEHAALAEHVQRMKNEVNKHQDRLQQAKAELLRVQRARDAARHGLSTSEQQLEKTRAERRQELQQVAGSLRDRLQAQLLHLDLPTACLHMKGSRMLHDAHHGRWQIPDDLCHKQEMEALQHRHASKSDEDAMRDVPLQQDYKQYGHDRNVAVCIHKFMLSMKGTDVAELLLHVHALLAASDSLNEAYQVAAEKLSRVG